MTELLTTIQTGRSPATGNRTRMPHHPSLSQEVTACLRTRSASVVATPGRTAAPAPFTASGIARDGTPGRGQRTSILVSPGRRPSGGSGPL